MRSISMGFPSGKAKMTLWKNTEDEESFPIKSITRKPYVLAYGIKYYLEEDEVQHLKHMLKIKNDVYYK